MVSLQRKLNASADETLRYTRAAEDRRNEVGALSSSLQEQAARADEAARRGEELRSSINARWEWGTATLLFNTFLSVFCGVCSSLQNVVLCFFRGNLGTVHQEESRMGLALRMVIDTSGQARKSKIWSVANRHHFEVNNRIDEMNPSFSFLSPLLFSSPAT